MIQSSAPGTNVKRVRFHTTFLEHSRSHTYKSEFEQIMNSSKYSSKSTSHRIGHNHDTEMSSSSSTNSRRITHNKSSSDQIRAQYLRRLGFGNARNTDPISSNKQNKCEESIMLKRFSYEDDINDYGTPASPSSSIWHSTSPTTIMGFTQRSNRRQKRSVSFSESVSVQLIPHKDMYSQRIRKHLWNDPEELVQNAERNCIEFAAENWDWRQVCDDDQFFTCPDTGKKIHPAHVHWLDRTMAARIASRQHSFLQRSRLMARQSSVRF